MNTLPPTPPSSPPPSSLSSSRSTSGPTAAAPGFAVRIAAPTRLFDARPDQPVLLSALAAGHALPSSCRNGTCRVCLCRLHSGRVYYRIAWPGLSAEEKAEGLFLPCVAYPASDLVMTLGELGEASAPGDAAP